MKWMQRSAVLLACWYAPPPSVGGFSTYVGRPGPPFSRMYLAKDKGRANVRFTGISASDVFEGGGGQIQKNSAANTVLSFLTSDVGSIALGLLGLLLLLVGRLVLDDNNDNLINAEAIGVTTRINLLAVLATGTVLLNGIAKLDVESALAPPVPLDGTLLDRPVIMWDDTAPAAHAHDISWALDALLRATPAGTVCLLRHRGGGDDDPNSTWTVMAMAGTVPTSPAVPHRTPLLDRLLLNKDEQESYLPTLQTLPARVEFTYMPSNTQAIVLVPVSSMTATAAGAVVVGVLVLGSNRAKSFTPKHLAWCRALARRLSTITIYAE